MLPMSLYAAHQGKFTLFALHLNIEADAGAEILRVFCRLRHWRLFMGFYVDLYGGECSKFWLWP